MTVSLAGNAAVHRSKNALPRLIEAHTEYVLDHVLFVHPEYLFDARGQLPAWCHVLISPQHRRRVFASHIRFFDEWKLIAGGDANALLDETPPSDWPKLPSSALLGELVLSDKYLPLKDSLDQVQVQDNHTKHKSHTRGFSHQYFCFV